MLRFFSLKRLLTNVTAIRKCGTRLLAIYIGLIITQNEMTSAKFEQHVNGILTTVSRVMTNSKLFVSRQSKFFFEIEALPNRI